MMKPINSGAPCVSITFKHADGNDFATCVLNAQAVDYLDSHHPNRTSINLHYDTDDCSIGLEVVENQKGIPKHDKCISCTKLAKLLGITEKVSQRELIWNTELNMYIAKLG